MLNNGSERELPAPGSQIIDLAAAALEHHQNCNSEVWLVSPGRPVLYFGDRERYLLSPVRVITVGLNPSRLEFPREAPFRRFSSSEEPADYLRSLDNYFENDPYREWFNSYEPALQGMDSSYYPGVGSSVAIHTDIGSVLPTDPTWSRLPPETQLALERVGVPMWHRLVEHLQPDIILASIAEAWFTKIRFATTTGWRTLLPITHTEDGKPRNRPLRVRQKWLRLGTGKKALLVHGPAAQQPLGALSRRERTRVGGEIIKSWVAHR